MIIGQGCERLSGLKSGFFERAMSRSRRAETGRELVTYYGVASWQLLYIGKFTTSFGALSNEFVVHQSL